MNPFSFFWTIGEILSDTNQKQDFIGWVVKDVKKESVAELEASRLSWYQVEDLIKSKAAAWFQQEYTKNMKDSTEDSSDEKIRFFEGLCFVFSERVPFGKKGQLSTLIKNSGGEVSYILGKKCTHFIATRDELESSSTKIATAKKMAAERNTGELFSLPPPHGNALPNYLSIMSRRQSILYCGRRVCLQMREDEVEGVWVWVQSAPQ